MSPALESTGVYTSDGIQGNSVLAVILMCTIMYVYIVCIIYKHMIVSEKMIIYWLAVWNIFLLSPIVGMMIQSDELHHFSEG